MAQPPRLNACERKTPPTDALPALRILKKIGPSCCDTTELRVAIKFRFMSSPRRLLYHRWRPPHAQPLFADPGPTAFLVLVFAAGCGNSPAAPTATPAQPTPPTTGPIPPGTPILAVQGQGGICDPRDNNPNFTPERNEELWQECVKVGALDRNFHHRAFDLPAQSGRFEITHVTRGMDYSEWILFRLLCNGTRVNLTQTGFRQVPFPQGSVPYGMQLVEERTYSGSIDPSCNYQVEIQGILRVRTSAAIATK